MPSKAAIAQKMDPPRFLLSEAEAALAVGIGSSYFRRLVDEGRMPKPKVLGKRRLWFVDDIVDTVKNLPYDGGPSEEADSWSDV